MFAVGHMFTPMCKLQPVDQTGNGLGGKTSCHVLIHVKMKLLVVAIFSGTSCYRCPKGYKLTGRGNCTAEVLKRLQSTFQRMLLHPSRWLA